MKENRPYCVFDVIPEYLYRVVCNAFVLFPVFSTALILYDSVSVVDSNCISREARKLKQKLGGKSRIHGSAVEFMSLYDRIEQRCNRLLPENHDLTHHSIFSIF